MLNFNWTEEAGGNQTLDMRLVISPDGTISVHNLKNPNESSRYNTPEECKADFSATLDRAV